MKTVSKDKIREMFSQAMSTMFRDEVPAYGTLIDLVKDVNAEVLASDQGLAKELDRVDGIDRISEERHGAIRLGTGAELSMMRRLFAVLGMYPVGYYDLSVAGIPVHSTAFRPVDGEALSINPFRVFTSLLRLDLIEDDVLRAEAEAILSSRNIFTARAIELIEKAEAQGGLTETDADIFVAEALETFRWHANALIGKEMFDKLLTAHRLIADVVSFRGPHINHLTPRTLDIDAVQMKMPERGIDPKAVIEGPPARKCPILLRQTSFKALSEPVYFDGEAGHHTARFGEIEQRGAALTPKGRALYDQLLDEVRKVISPAPDGSNQAEYMRVLTEKFAAFPDDWNEMREQGLAYFQYYHIEGHAEDLESALKTGVIGFAPIVYEDFLPVSAAGIFQSNLGDDKGQDIVANANQAVFEQVLGTSVLDEFAHYAKLESLSIETSLAKMKSSRA